MKSMGRGVHLLVALAAFGCSEDPKCELEDELRDVAGRGATNCGRVPVGADGAAVDGCVVTAFSDGRAFYARYDVQGIDSLVARGIAGDPKGQVTLFLWDSDPGGGNADDAAVVDAQDCVGPGVKPSSERDSFEVLPLDCSSTTNLRRVCE
jgi:hypothetical protein